MDSEEGTIGVYLATEWIERHFNPSYSTHYSAPTRGAGAGRLPDDWAGAVALINSLIVNSVALDLAERPLC